MKLWRLRLNFALTVLLAVPSLCADSWAVVIGIDSYERLRFPRHSFALKDAVGPPQAASDQDRAEYDGFVLAGDFIMGSNNGRNDSEKPQRRVHLNDYFIDKYPVRNTAFGRFAEATGYRTETGKGDRGYVWTGAEWMKKSDANRRAPSGSGSSYKDVPDRNPKGPESVACELCAEIRGSERIQITFEPPSATVTNRTPGAPSFHSAAPRCEPAFPSSAELLHLPSIDLDDRIQKAEGAGLFPLERVPADDRAESVPIPDCANLLEYSLVRLRWTS